MDNGDKGNKKGNTWEHYQPNSTLGAPLGVFQKGTGWTTTYPHLPNSPTPRTYEADLRIPSQTFFRVAQPTAGPEGSDWELSQNGPGSIQRGQSEERRRILGPSLVGVLPSPTPPLPVTWETMPPSENFWKIETVPRQNRRETRQVEDLTQDQRRTGV